MTPDDRSERIAAHKAEKLSWERIAEKARVLAEEQRQILKVIYDEEGE